MRLLLLLAALAILPASALEGTEPGCVITIYYMKNHPDHVGFKVRGEQCDQRGAEQAISTLLAKILRHPTEP